MRRSVQTDPTVTTPTRYASPARRTTCAHVASPCSHPHDRHPTHEEQDVENSGPGERVSAHARVLAIEIPSVPSQTTFASPNAARSHA